VWDSSVEAGEFYDLAGQAIEKRFSTKAMPGTASLVKKYSANGRSVQLTTAEIGGRPVVIYEDLPSGASPNIINPAAVKLVQ
jgi:hypothetical protein